jgi:hypothetical protein
VLEPVQVQVLAPERAQAQAQARELAPAQVLELEPAQVLEPEQVLAPEQAQVLAPEQVLAPVRAREPVQRTAPKRGQARGAAFTPRPGTSATDLGHSTSLPMTPDTRRFRTRKSLTHTRSIQMEPHSSSNG